METGRRRRGESFHEDFDEDKPNTGPSHSMSGLNHQQINQPNICIHNVNGNRHPIDNRIEFITPQFDQSSAPEPLDLSQLEDDDTEDDDDDEYEDGDNENSGNSIEAEEAMYSRGRSRSHSLHSEDAPNAGVPGYHNTVETIVVPIDSTGGSVHMNSEMKLFDKIERTGPLHIREVQALRKGLEQATLMRNKEELLEEEMERKDAEAERALRVSSSAIGHSSVISDQIIKKVKILVLGDSGVGKSSLILRWTMDAYNPTLVGTVGVNFKSKRVSINGELVQVQVWDTAGQEHFHKITTSYYRGANAIMLIFDVSDRRTIENVEYWIKNIKEHASDSVYVFLVGNKVDLRSGDLSHLCVEYEKGLEVAETFKVPYYETSAKDSVNVDEAFMASVRSILAAEAKANSISNSRRKNLVEKTKKVSLFKNLIKERSKSTPTHSPPFSSILMATNSGSNNNMNNYNNMGKGQSEPSDGKEKCAIS